MSSSGAGPKDGTASRSERAPSRLTASESFRAVYREGTRLADDLLVIYVRPTGRRERRLGISIPGRIGAAVRRNRLKRRLREAVRGTAEMLPSGVDAVLVPRSGAEQAAISALQESLRGLFNRAAGSLR